MNALERQHEAGTGLAARDIQAQCRDCRLVVRLRPYTGTEAVGALGWNGCISAWSGPTMP